MPPPLRLVGPQTPISFEDILVMAIVCRMEHVRYRILQSVDPADFLSSSTRVSYPSVSPNFIHPKEFWCSFEFFSDLDFLLKGAPSHLISCLKEWREEVASYAKAQNQMHQSPPLQAMLLTKTDSNALESSTLSGVLGLALNPTTQPESHFFATSHLNISGQKGVFQWHDRSFPYCLHAAPVLRDEQGGSFDQDDLFEFVINFHFLDLQPLAADLPTMPFSDRFNALMVAREHADLLAQTRPPPSSPLETSKELQSHSVSASEDCHSQVLGLPSHRDRARL